ncbi:hypothetical protein G6F57_005378 [Rhizopus arrhizus]|uniref:BHLH domain-containing protein n=1 Tax=Rhizopus oryzae TaxID=64495 RepID=A0A9P6XJH8_RHIOR|nr:hypothetical protein G6F24_006470 [Rhizopus arrhizus]KAG0776941.1 hypothetical protein G6F22_012214 [Rhizopus arrhizus]KAG0791393.1 hypothetical protein G6F21_005118 [Rhizopus arrhizus]KAG0812882.1 hypothetical protein G6F20_006005 [Rhizopus arrhizus]KAG0825406.1 hypothetical protein G6F19_009827 [Rhizopus arrhizus]
MSQDNLFSSNFQPPSQPIFDPNSGLYGPNISIQFAASVPHRQQSQPHLSVNFQASPFQQSMIQSSCMQSYPNSPFDRPESLISSGSSRQLQTKAERRAEHNATERARRENLNAKFQQLAHILPNLQNDSRHSKVTIIDRTLDYVKGSITKEERMQNRIKELEKINSYLLSQLDSRNSKRKKSIQSDPSLLSPSTSSIRSEESRDKTDDESIDNKSSIENNLNHPSLSSQPVIVNQKNYWPNDPKQGSGYEYALMAGPYIKENRPNIKQGHYLSLSQQQFYNLQQ